MLTHAPVRFADYYLFGYTLPRILTSLTSLPYISRPHGSYASLYSWRTADDDDASSWVIFNEIGTVHTVPRLRIEIRCRCRMPSAFFSHCMCPKSILVPLTVLVIPIVEVVLIYLKLSSFSSMMLEVSD